MKIILGTKEEMTEIFTEEGTVVPATVISAGPVVITQVKTKETDGYNAVAAGYGEKKQKNINKAQRGQWKDLGAFRFVKEFKGDDQLPQKGERINVSVFEPGEKIRISGVSKGKGFQGVVKRHGFKGGPRSHGQKHSEREAGSIGAQGPQRVLKGKKMPGRMGSKRVTQKSATVVAVDPKNNKLVVSGAVPGRRGTLVEIQAM